jgi:sigma-70-like protein
VEGSPLEEREVVLRAQRGDERAFEDLIRPYEEVAFRVAYLTAGTAHEAEDAVQEGFVNAWRALGPARRLKPDAAAADLRGRGSSRRSRSRPTSTTSGCSSATSRPGS